jgi:hypothetical protein
MIDLLFYLKTRKELFCGGRGYSSQATLSDDYVWHPIRTNDQARRNTYQVWEAIYKLPQTKKWFVFT